MDLITFLKDLYAPILATIIAIVQGITYYRDNKAKVKVSASVGTQALVFNNGKVGDYDPTVFIHITNLSKDIRVVHTPNVIAVDQGKKKSYALIDFEKHVFPKSLHPGELHTMRVPASDFKVSLPPMRSEFLTFTVEDTHGKRYKSNKIKLPRS